MTDAHKDAIISEQMQIAQDKIDAIKAGTYRPGWPLRKIIRRSMNKMSAKIYDYMCKKCWYSWRKKSDKPDDKCPKCGSKEIDVDYDISL